MKKRAVIIIVIVIMILVTLASFVIYRQTVGNSKNYEIEPIKEYHYFVLKQNDLYGVIDRKGNNGVTYGNCND